MYSIINKYKLLALHLMVLVLGFTGILGKLITLESTHLVWYRMLIAFYFIIYFFINNKIEWNKLIPKYFTINWRRICCCIALAIFF